MYLGSSAAPSHCCYYVGRKLITRQLFFEVNFEKSIGSSSELQGSEKADREREKATYPVRGTKKARTSKIRLLTELASHTLESTVTLPGRELIRTGASSLAAAPRLVPDESKLGSCLCDAGIALRCQRLPRVG